MANLDIAIAGAGVAGLATAISVARAGHRANIYERSHFKNEVGAAVNMPPQATRILRAWGIAGPNPIRDTPYHDMASGKLLNASLRRTEGEGDLVPVVMTASFDGDEDLYEAPFVSYHRWDLHTALRKVAEDAGVLIVLGKTVVDIDCAAASLTLTDAAACDSHENVQKDLVIVADGVNSKFVKTITGHDIPLLPTERTAYRSLIKTETLLKDSEACKLFSNGAEHCISGCTDPATKVFAVIYPCREGELMNFGIFHPHKEGAEERRGVLDIIHDWHPAYKAAIKHGEQRAYPVRAREPLPTYVNGRAIMLGDAAHPMYPTLAGGGSTALEDAAALEVLLSDVKPADTTLLDQRLSLWNALRLPRDIVTQVLSTTMLQPRPASAFAGQLRHVYTGPLPDEVLAGWTPLQRKFFCLYDVFEVTRTALTWAEKNDYPEDALLRLQDEDVIEHFGA